MSSSRPDTGLQNRKVPSRLPLASVLPSGVKAND